MADACGCNDVSRGQSADAAPSDRDRRAGHRIRRHRDQPDLHDPDRVQSRRPASRADLHRQRVRGCVNDLLVRDDHRHADLHHARDASRQQRRRRDHGADHPAAPLDRHAKQAQDDVAGRARTVRRFAVLRRQHDHTGYLGPVRRRGPQGDLARLPRFHRADHRGDHRCPVLRAAARHRGRRAVLRPRDDRLVSVDRRVRSARHRRQPRDPEGAVAHLRRDVSGGPLPHRVLLPSRDRVVRHRRRGTVCRHGALRPQVHHLRLARPRAARVHAELLRSGCAGAGRRVEGERAVLPTHPGVGADSDGAGGDGGDGHRVAGGDHRGVLGGVAGSATGLSAAAARSNTPPHPRSARSTCRGSTVC